MPYYHPNYNHNWNNGNHSHHVYNGNHHHHYQNGPYIPPAPRPPPTIRPQVQNNGISAQEAQMLRDRGLPPPPVVFPRLLSPEEIAEIKKAEKRMERQQVAETSHYADNLRRVPVQMPVQVQSHVPIPIPNVQRPIPNIQPPIPQPPIRASSQDRADSAQTTPPAQPLLDDDQPLLNPDWQPQWGAVVKPRLRPRQTRDARDMGGAWRHWSTMAGFWSVPNENYRVNSLRDYDYARGEDTDCVV